jgi:GTP-binding protein
LNSSNSIYWETSPPTDRELAAARWFFKQHPARKVWTAAEWRKINNDSGLLAPEVAFLGRSNVGKSSLLNAVLGSRDFNRVGPHPGKTKVMHAWGLAASDSKTGRALKGWNGLTDTRVTVLDAPGYGYGSDRDWGAEIITYLKRRKQLRRIFVLIDAMHGPKKHDRQMLGMLRELNIPHQLIVSKADRAKDLATTLRSLQEVAQPHAMPFAGLGEILAVGGLEDSVKARPRGVDSVQWAVLRAAGLDEFAMNHFERLDKKTYDEHAATPRQPNADSHLTKPQIRPSATRHEPARLLQAELRSIPTQAELELATETDLRFDGDVESHVQHETSPTTRLNPNVYRGMDALAEMTGHKATTRPRPPTARTARRPGSTTRDVRGKSGRTRRK